MSTSHGKILLMIPCYNEESRLDLANFKDYLGTYDFLFINDGSTDSTKVKLDSIKSEHLEVLHLTKNVGKAAAVHQGFQYFLKKENRYQYEWVGFWDADLATPLDQVKKMINFSIEYPGIHSIWGSRIYRLGSRIQRSFTRHIFGRFFATIAYFILKIDSYDSQCGAKLFKAEIINDTFKEKFITRWIFDIEILIRLNQRKFKVIEFPLEYWEDIAGSKLNPFKEFFRTIIDLYRIKRHYRVN